MDCPYCLSLWFALPFAIWLATDAAQGAVLWLGLSGGACAIEHVAAALRRIAQPTIIELPLMEESRPMDAKQQD